MLSRTPFCAQTFYFEVVPFVYYFFASFAQWDISKNIAMQDVWNFTAYIFISDFLWFLTLKSLMHIEFILPYSIRRWASSTFFCAYRTEDIFKTLLCFMIGTRSPWGRKSTRVYTNELGKSQAGNLPWGNAVLSWGRQSVSDAHSDIFLPLPPHQRPKRQFSYCNMLTPCCTDSPLCYRMLEPFTNNVAEATWALLQTSLSPSNLHQTSPSCKWSGQAAGSCWMTQSTPPSD